MKNINNIKNTKVNNTNNVNKVNNNNTIKVFTKSIALELRLRGFSIIKTEPNYKKPQYDVYIFNDTEKLRNELNDIIKNRKMNASTQGTR